MEPTSRKPYPFDVSDDDGAFVAPYLFLMRLHAPQPHDDSREMPNALRWIGRIGAPWRSLPTNFPPWEIVAQQAQRWVAANYFVTMAQDLRALLRSIADKVDQWAAAILDSRTLQSTSGRVAPAGYNGAKRRNGSEMHEAVDTLGHLLDLLVTPASTNDWAAGGGRRAAGGERRAAGGELSAAVQAVTGGSVEIAFVDDGDNGPNARAAAKASGIELVAVTLPEAKRGFVLLPHRWVMEPSVTWAAQFRRLTRDDKRLPETVRGLNSLQRQEQPRMPHQPVCLLTRADGVTGSRNPPFGRDISARSLRFPNLLGIPSGPASCDREHLETCQGHYEHLPTNGSRD